MRFLILAAALAAGACAYERTPRLESDPWRRPPISSAQVRRDLAAALERKDPVAVTRGMAALSRMGAALSPETQARLAPLLDRRALPRGWRPAGPLPEALGHHFRYNARDHEAGELVATVPAEHRLIEGIAYDEANSRLFVSSVVGRSILVQEGETWRALPTAAPLGGVFGMAVDGPRRLLWVASGLADVVPAPETAFSGLVAIDLDRLEEVRRVPTPGFRPGDVAVAGDGTVYASDGQSGAILRCRPGCAVAETLVPPGLLRSPQGLAVWPGGRRLYVADYEKGIVLVSLESRAMRPLVAREPQMLEGMDGRYLYDGRLIAIQNGTRPRRIVAIELGGSGRVVESVEVREQSVPGWGEPTLGALRRGELLYVADAQWETYDRGGAVRAGAVPRPTAIRSVFLDDIVVTQGGGRGRTAAP